MHGRSSIVPVTACTACLPALTIVAAELSQRSSSNIVYVQIVHRNPSALHVLLRNYIPLTTTTQSQHTSSHGADLQHDTLARIGACVHSPGDPKRGSILHEEPSIKGGGQHCAAASQDRRQQIAHDATNVEQWHHVEAHISRAQAPGSNHAHGPNSKCVQGIRDYLLLATACTHRSFSVVMAPSVSFATHWHVVRADSESIAKSKVTHRLKGGHLGRNHNHNSIHFPAQVHLGYLAL